MQRSGNRRRDGPSPAIMFLLVQIYQALERLPVKPPVTIGLLFINIYAHLFNAEIFGYYLSNINQNCIHPEKIISSLFNRKEMLLNRLILSSVIHVDDMHLYYNMLSLLWKGIQLEGAMGSFDFGVLVAFSLVASHSIMILLAYVLHHYFAGAVFSSGYTSCAVGFSAVLFALKYVLNYNSPSTSNVMGVINVPTKFACWAELVLISVISPNASFVGHLAGIFAGILWTQRLVLRQRLEAAGGMNRNNIWGRYVGAAAAAAGGGGGRARNNNNRAWI